MIGLAEFVASMGAAYQSLDVRHAFGPQEQNVKASPSAHPVRRLFLTVIRLSRDPVDKVRAQQQQLLQRYGIIDVPSLQISFQAVEIPKDGWQRVGEVLPSVHSELGEWWTRSVALRITGKPYPWTYPLAWPVAEGSLLGSQAIGQDLTPAVNSELIRQGASFTTALVAIRTLLEKEDISENLVSGCYFVVPVYVRIDFLEFEPRRIKVSLSADSSIPNLTLYLQQLKAGRLDTPIPLSAPVEIKYADMEVSEDGIGKWTKGFEGFFLGERDEIKVIVAHRELALEVDNRRDSLEHLRFRKQTVQAPLLKVVPDFLPWDILRQLLTESASGVRPEVAPRDRAYVFESSVTRLLALLGFVSIHLGKWGFERHKGAPDSTVDILCSHPKSQSLWLIGCTTADPRPQDFDTLKRAGDAIGQTLAGGSNPVQLLLFCGVRAPTAKQLAMGSGVRLFDCEDVSQILDNLKTGDGDAVLANFFEIKISSGI